MNIEIDLEKFKEVFKNKLMGSQLFYNSLQEYKDHRSNGHKLVEKIIMEFSNTICMSLLQTTNGEVSNDILNSISGNNSEIVKIEIDEKAGKIIFKA